MKKYRILLLTPKNFAKTTQLIKEAANEVFIVTHAFIEDVILKIDQNIKIISVVDGKKIDLTKVDYVFAKVDSHRAERAFPIITAFHMLGIQTNFPPETIYTAHDKFLTNMLLAKNNILTPKTYIANKETINLLEKEINFPIMLKLKHGSGGKGVMFMDNMNALNSVVSSLESLKQTMLIQEFVKNKGEDIRMLVGCDEVIGSMKRIITQPGETRSNIKCGNIGEKYEPNMDLKRMAFKCAKLINADICGVDLIESTNKQYYCIELNINPGIVGLTKATGINIAKRIIDKIYLKICQKDETH